MKSFANDEEMHNKWMEIKMKNKKRFAEWIEKNCKVQVNINSMFDVLVKRIHEYKR